MTLVQELWNCLIALEPDFAFLFLSALAFAVLMRTGIYPPELRSINLDSDWIYRSLLPACWQRVAAGFDVAKRGLSGQGVRAGAALLAAVIRHTGADARLARTGSTRATALSVLVLLLGYLALYYA
jgi:multicomponent Na+:H+ antiporter subunit D